MSEKPCGAYFFAFFENFFVPILTSGGLAAVSSSAFAALYSAFGKYDVVHIHAEGPAFFAWLPKMFGKRVVVTVHGIDWQREKWQSGLGSKFIHQGEKNAAKYADEVIVLSKGVQDYFKETYGKSEREKELAVVQEELQQKKQIAGNTEVLLTVDTVGEAGDVMHLSQNVVETFIERIEVFNDKRVKIHFTFEDVLAGYAE